MRINKRNAFILFLVTFSVLIFIRFFAPGSSYQVNPYLKPAKFFSPVNTNELAFNPIIRIHDVNNTFICSGVVVNIHHAVTASHCVVNSVRRMNLTPFRIYNSNGNFVTIAVAEGLDTYKDSAILRGNFESFLSEKVDFIGATKVEYGDTLKTCGYPSGQNEICCFEVIFRGNAGFKYKADGPPLIKGMSGGPVYRNGVLIAVNSSVTNFYIEFGPILGLQTQAKEE